MLALLFVLSTSPSLHQTLPTANKAKSRLVEGLNASQVAQRPRVRLALTPRKHQIPNAECRVPSAVCRVPCDEWRVTTSAKLPFSMPPSRTMAAQQNVTLIHDKGLHGLPGYRDSVDRQPSRPPQVGLLHFTYSWCTEQMANSRFQTSSAAYYPPWGLHAAGETSRPKRGAARSIHVQ